MTKLFLPNISTFITAIEGFSLEDLSDRILKVVIDELNEQWSNNLELKDIPVSVEPDAARQWVGSTMAHMDVLIKIAAGLAVMNDRSSINAEDIQKATVIKNKGLKNVVGEIKDNKE